MTLMRVMLPSASRGATSAGSARYADRRAAQAVDLDDLAAHRLAEARRRLADLLEQEVRRVATIDVAGRDLRRGDVVLGQRQLAAVVGDPADAVELAGACAVEHEDLAAAARWRRRSHRPCARSGIVSSTTPYGSLATM